MISFEDRLYQKQAERITELLDVIKSLQSNIAKMSDAAYFYDALVKAIGDDDMLRDEWRRFIAILRLAKPDLPGITKAMNEFPE